MISMGMNLGLSAELRQTLSNTGGLTRSIFPEVEKWLDAETDRWNSLRHIGRNKDMDRYHSVIDFVFCETFSCFRNRCFRYYERDDRKAWDIINDFQRKVMEEILLEVVKQGYEVFCSERAESWRKIQRRSFKSLGEIHRDIMVAYNYSREANSLLSA